MSIRIHTGIAGEHCVAAEPQTSFLCDGSGFSTKSSRRATA